MTFSMIQPNLNTIVSYASAPPRRRRDQAQRARLQAESDYSPATDFWKSMRTAVCWERKTTRDGVPIFDAAERAISRKRASFQVVADRWSDISTRWVDSSYRKPPSGIVALGSLEIAVRPLFSEAMADGSIEHIALWMNIAEPTGEGIDAALRLITLLDPTARAIFVDVRRGNVYAGTAEMLEHDDEALAAMAADFLRDAA